MAKIHPGVKPNLEGWRWRLVLWLTGGEIEAVPLLPSRPIHRHETVVVRLGQELGLNTVEVKSMAPETNQLVPMTHGMDDAMPNTFIALDVTDGHFFGTFTGWEDMPNVNSGEVEPHAIIESVAGNTYDIPKSWILKSYWAPMGYRP